MRVELKNMKERVLQIIAFYLPQYHEIPENNKWWGDGFTEWNHVKTARKLFNDHWQPRVPLDGYYDLNDKATLIRQVELAQKYGIDGFAYYHYWFEGKLLLEKPVENLKKWSDIQHNYFFFWANHDWNKAKKGRRELLIKQNYGGEEDWKRHYEYFKNFFDDTRYIKNRNRPVIGIYQPGLIPYYDEMIKCWNKMAINDGFDGIYIIESYNKAVDIKRRKSQYPAVIREPNYSLEQIRRNESVIRRGLRFINNRTVRIPFLKKYDYSEVSYYEKCACNIVSDKLYYSVSTGWDNTPRHGKRGSVVIRFDIENFKRTFEYVYSKSLLQGKEYVFINAWNEWAEGMYLEPDINNEYELLETIKRVKETVT